VTIRGTAIPLLDRDHTAITLRYRRRGFPALKQFSKRSIESDNFATLCTYQLNIGATSWHYVQHKNGCLIGAAGAASKQSKPQ
jgi:hypothetical protein